MPENHKRIDATANRQSRSAGGVLTGLAQHPSIFADRLLIQALLHIGVTQQTMQAVEELWFFLPLDPRLHVRDNLILHTGRTTFKQHAVLFGRFVGLPLLGTCPSQFQPQALIVRIRLQLLAQLVQGGCHSLDRNGFARVDGIDPGSCSVSFPDRDRSGWRPRT